MNGTWQALERELDVWASAGLEATFWLRDDDAVADTPALQHLLDIGRDHGIPLCLAVIPRDAGEDLARAVSGRDDVRVIQHGWCHVNHAGPHEKKFELGDHRPASVVAGELAQGDARLRALFDGQYVKVLAPPWNRIGTGIADHLAGWGYLGLSVFGPRTASVPARDVVRVNTHVDIIDWKGSRGFRGTEDVIGQAIRHLEARRTQAVDRDEPTGLITHHLVHDDGCWDFIAAFTDFTKRHDGVRWLSADDVFSQER